MQLPGRILTINKWAAFPNLYNWFKWRGLKDVRQITDKM
jgi:hypothetical protein